ncbi:MAG TPA: hypothetical protein VFQ37_15215 [Mycobacterium sp.]|nr:hypothetical protein [Mycobacterium sp.]
MPKWIGGSSELRAENADVRYQIGLSMADTLAKLDAVEYVAVGQNSTPQTASVR